MKNIGQVISYLRKSKKLSQEELSELLGCSREFISQIERNKRNIPEYFILPLSKFLSYNIENLIKNIDKYKTLEHYIISSKLIDLIEEMNYPELDTFLKNEIILNEFTYGYPLILKLYCTALIETYINKNVYTSIELCLEVLGIDDMKDIKDFHPVLNKEFRYYSTILILGVNLFELGNYELYTSLLENTIDFLEDNIFNKALPISTVHSYYKKFYIVILNNYADTLFVLGDYKSATLFCEKATDNCINFEITNILYLLLELKTEILYKSNKLDEAKTTFSDYQSMCRIVKKADHLKATENAFKTKYPLLFK